MFSRYAHPIRTLGLSWCWIDWPNLRDETSPLISYKQSDERFTVDEIESIEAITVFRPDSRAKDPSPLPVLEDLKRARNLRFLSIPHDQVRHLDASSIAGTLEHLHLTPARSQSGYAFWEDGNGPLMFEQAMPRLRSLKTWFSPVYFQNFDAGLYPNLEWVGTSLSDFDKAGKMFALFSGSERLKFYSIDSIKNKDLLKKIPAHIEGLRLWSITCKQFDFSGLARFERLKYLVLHGSASPLDCAVLGDLTELEELTIFDFGSMRGLEVLYGLKRLKKVHIYPKNERDLDDKFKAGLKAALPQTLISFEI